jgi:hypothetical protein
MATLGNIPFLNRLPLALDIYQSAPWLFDLAFLGIAGGWLFRFGGEKLFKDDKKAQNLASLTGLAIGILTALWLSSRNVHLLDTIPWIIALIIPLLAWGLWSLLAEKVTSWWGKLLLALPFIIGTLLIENFVFDVLSFQGKNYFFTPLLNNNITDTAILIGQFLFFIAAIAGLIMLMGKTIGGGTPGGTTTGGGPGLLSKLWNTLKKIPLPHLKKPGWWSKLGDALDKDITGPEWWKRWRKGKKGVNPQVNALKKAREKLQKEQEKKEQRDLQTISVIGIKPNNASQNAGIITLLVEGTQLDKMIPGTLKFPYTSNTRKQPLNIIGSIKDHTSISFKVDVNVSVDQYQNSSTLGEYSIQFIDTDGKTATFLNVFTILSTPPPEDTTRNTGVRNQAEQLRNARTTLHTQNTRKLLNQIKQWDTRMNAALQNLINRSISTYNTLETTANTWDATKFKTIATQEYVNYAGLSDGLQTLYSNLLRDYLQAIKFNLKNVKQELQDMLKTRPQREIALNKSWKTYLKERLRVRKPFIKAEDVSKEIKTLLNGLTAEIKEKEARQILKRIAKLLNIEAKETEKAQKATEKAQDAGEAAQAQTTRDVNTKQNDDFEFKHAEEDNKVFFTKPASRRGKGVGEQAEKLKTIKSAPGEVARIPAFKPEYHTGTEQQEIPEHILRQGMANRECITIQHATERNLPRPYFKRERNEQFQFVITNTCDVVQRNIFWKITLFAPDNTPIDLRSGNWWTLQVTPTYNGRQQLSSILQDTKKLYGPTNLINKQQWILNFNMFITMRSPPKVKYNLEGPYTLRCEIVSNNNTIAYDDLTFEVT